MTFPARHIGIAIDRPAKDVYAYASNPENLPAWASGLASGVAKDDGFWTADSPLGKITIAFAEDNDFGVLDHDVRLPNGTTFHNPMRVVPNGDGCEVTFTLFRLPGMTDDDFEKDAATVAKDLAMLKTVLEAA